MQPDPSPLSIPPSSDRQAEMAMRRAMLQSGPVLIIPRRIFGGVAATLDGLSKEALPRLWFEGALADLKPRLRRAVVERLAEPRWLANWLIDDVLEHSKLIVSLTGTPTLRVRLDVVDDDCCPKFHVDDVRLRLVTTYRGPGTEWIPPRLAARFVDGRLPPADTVRHLARGEVAVLRGGRGATPERPGVLHRSPPIAGTGVVRLFLAIDEIGRSVH